MTLSLGLDVGTQGTKAIVYSTVTRAVIGRGAASYGILPSDVQGRAEQDPAIWIQGCIDAARQALAGVDASAVTAVGVSGQQHGLVLLDASGQVLRPAKLWCDTESSEEAKELSEALGFTLVPAFTATKLLWVKRHEPLVYGRTAHVLLPHDYINLWLTGRYVMECSDASGTGLLDVKARQWDPRAIALVDERLQQWLPPLVGPNEVIGTLTPAAAAALGLGGSVVVSPGGGDNAMSALGVGAISPGSMVVSLGTSGTIFGNAPEPILDPSGAICPFCDATGGGLPLLCTLNCTLPAQEVSSAFGLSHEELTALAETQESPGCSGVNFLPYLQGERTPNLPHATGTITGLRPGLLRPGLLYRAALEGATLSLLAGLRHMRHAGLAAPQQLLLVGGGSKNRLWRQIVADAFQLPIRVPLEPESAALGAALQAAACYSHTPVAAFIEQHRPPVALEVITPAPSAAIALERAYQRHVHTGNELFGETDTGNGKQTAT